MAICCCSVVMALECSSDCCSGPKQVGPVAHYTTFGNAAMRSNLNWKIRGIELVVIMMHCHGSISS